MNTNPVHALVVGAGIPVIAGDSRKEARSRDTRIIRTRVVIVTNDCIENTITIAANVIRTEIGVIANNRSKTASSIHA